MAKRILIDTCPNTWDLYDVVDGWKEYIYGPKEEFNEIFVVIVPKEFNSTEDASWYRKAIEYIENNDIDYGETEIINTLNKMYPDEKFDTFDITGYVQGEFATVLYKANGIEVSADFRECFGDFYFGHVTEIIDEEENVHDYVADSELWKHEDNLDEFVRDVLQIDEDEEIEILKSDGYITVKNWVTV